MKLVNVYFFALLAVFLCISVVYAQWLKPLSSLFQTCWFGEKPLTSWMQKLRGNNYWLSTGGTQQQKYCLITSWAVSHVVLYAIIGYMFPNMFWHTLLIGISYEILEWCTLECHDVLDIVWNSVGFLIGAAIKKSL